MTRKYNFILLSLAVCIAAATALQLHFNGSEEESVRQLIRWSVRISTVLFSLAFGISSVQFFLKDAVSSLVLKYRPHIGLAFGAFHTAHLLFLIWLQNAIHPVFTLAKTSSLLGGGLAYVFMYLMMLTTYPQFKSRMSTAQWKLLHTVGGYWIWLIFFRTYFKKVVFKEEAYFLFGLLVLVFVLRISKLFFNKEV
jgi:hypothetical protein